MAIHYGPLKTVEGLNKMPTLQNVLERDESIELDIELGLWKKQKKKYNSYANKQLLRFERNLKNREEK